jgi:hypothetical protein
LTAQRVTPTVTGEGFRRRGGYRVMTRIAALAIVLATGAVAAAFHQQL